MLKLSHISHNNIGCLNGGGQIRPSQGESVKDVLGKVEAIYESVRCAYSNCNVLTFARYCGKLSLLAKLTTYVKWLLFWAVKVYLNICVASVVVTVCKCSVFCAPQPCSA